MRGSGKWVKSLIGLSKPEKEDSKVSARRCYWFPGRKKTERVRFFLSAVFGVFLPSGIICAVVLGKFWFA
jgi:hypothetical protein